MSASHQFADERYELLRKQARTLAEEAIPADVRHLLRMAAIDQDALAQSVAWEAKRKAQGIPIPWSFPRGFMAYRFRHPNRLDVAVWAKNTLCSLAIGIPTKTASSMRLDIIEASPETTILSSRVLPINLIAYRAYAQLIGAASITLMRPLNDKLIRYYKTHGFIYLKSQGSAPARMWKPL